MLLQYLKEVVENSSTLANTPSWSSWNYRLTGINANIHSSTRNITEIIMAAMFSLRMFTQLQIWSV